MAAAVVVGGGRRVLVAGLTVLLSVEADVGLQGGGGQPLLGEAALQEGDAGGEVGEAVHPARGLTPTQQLRNREYVSEYVSVLFYTDLRDMWKTTFF